MVRRAYAQRSVFEVLLPDADKLWDPILREVDRLLDDEPLVDVIVDALARRHPLSRRRGRLSTPATVVLRMLVLKHLYRWSFDECEREVRGSLVYREFCGIGCERVPDAKTLLRLAQLIDAAMLQTLLARLVQLARARRVVRGHRLRVDTTVVETHIHYPRDSELLADGVRMITRTMNRLRARFQSTAPRMRDRTRSINRRVFEIGQRSRTAGLRSTASSREKAKARITTLYRESMRITRATLREAEASITAIRRPTSGPLARLHTRLQQTVGLVRRVLAQTRARVLQGDTHYPHKVLSLVEPHTEAIRKGKAAKQTEFGKMVKIQEAEAQFITDYTVCAARVPTATCGCRASSVMNNSSDTLHDWPSLTAASARGPTRKRPTRVACTEWPCRVDVASPGRAGFIGRCVGGPAARAASVCSNNAMDWRAVVTTASKACTAGLVSASSRTTCGSSVAPVRPRQGDADDSRWRRGKVANEHRGRQLPSRLGGFSLPISHREVT